MSERPGTGVPEINPKEIVNDGTNQSPGLGWQISEETRQRIEALEAEIRHCNRSRVELEGQRNALKAERDRLRVKYKNLADVVRPHTDPVTAEHIFSAAAALAEHKEG